MKILSGTKLRVSFILVFSLLAVLILGGCNNSPAVAREIMVFAGSASKPPMDEAALAFKEQTGIKVNINYGGSGTMLSQMKISQTGDIYIPGSPDYLVKAERDGVTDPATTQIVAYLLPVISVQKGNPENIRSLTDLTKPGIKVGIGNPSTVCVGLYAIEIFEKAGMLESVYGNIITNAESCEKTATLLSLKSVDAIIGWDVFHHWDPENIDTIYLQPEQTPRIAYIPAAISTYSKNTADAQAFIGFLTSDKVQAIFQKWGYITSETEIRQFAPDAVIGGEYELPEAYEALIK
ncbi:MAG: molybdate ABC transporter substrate-binding protein [Dehalococcoidales bacterium]|nr:molybdate ABC transporter substrate-binding protein [Dehalococcoidales bacterium]